MHPRTERILKKFPDAVVVEIEHYKDVFCRSHQNAALQHFAQNLILAGKEQNFLYKGAPVCQDFGNSHFYYVSMIMNCVYHCEYCYLKGMYPSGNIVLFVNLEDCFARVDDILKEHSLYLCVSYDTDLLGLEGIAGYADEWVQFAKAHPQLKIEIRTKSANLSFFSDVQLSPNVIYAFTLSPQCVVERYEHHTPSLSKRLDCVETAVLHGLHVRLAFDPMIYIRGWKEAYHEMLCEISDRIGFDRIEDASVGTFRISQEYLKKMRRDEPFSAVAQFPYENDNGYYHYPLSLMQEMESFLVSDLARRMPKERIFVWNA